MPNIQRLFKLNWHEFFFFIRASLLTVFCSLIIFITPKRFIFRRLGEKGIESSFEATQWSLDETLQVEKAVRRAVRYLPWRTKCFAQAIAAKRLLQKKKIPSTIYLGVAKRGEDKMIAHAWLRSGNRIVTGKEEVSKFTPILFFT